MAMLTNDIYVGSVSAPIYHFTNEQIELGGAKGNFATDIIGNELSIDQFTATVRLDDGKLTAFEFITADDYDFYTDDDEWFSVSGPADASDISDTPYVADIPNSSINGVSFKLLKITGVLEANQDAWDYSQHVGTNDNNSNIGIGSVNTNGDVVAAVVRDGNELKLYFASLSYTCAGTVICKSNSLYTVPTSGGAIITYITNAMATGTPVYTKSASWSNVNTALSAQSEFNIPYFSSFYDFVIDAYNYLTKAHSGYYPGESDNMPFERTIPYGIPVWWYVNNAFMTKGFAKSVERVSKYNYKITCTSGIGLLDTKMHDGGIYQNKSVIGILNEIIGDALTFVPSQDLQGVTVTGHLPYDTARNNLHRVLFAIGAILNFGMGIADYFIGYPQQAAIDIPSSNIALQGSVTYQLPTNTVEVTEHAFFDGNEPTETLYDSSTQVSGLMVVFDKPIVESSLVATENLTINKSHENYAIVSGYGTLTGRPYTHTTQIQKQTNNPNGDQVRIKRVTDNELVNALNSYNVAKRLLSYYGMAQTVKTKILLGSNFHILRCGKPYTFKNPYGELVTGYLTKQDALVTSVVGSQCQMITGYQPGANGNTFTRVIVIDASYVATYGNTWTVPDGVTYAKFVLIGGGNKGTAGQDGADGLESIVLHTETHQGEQIAFYTDYYVYENADQPAAEGGDPGTAGLQGKVETVEHTVTPGETVTFSLGAGGNVDTDGVGTPTTASSQSIGNVSSDTGSRTLGYYDPIYGEVYAAPGNDGVKGGNGGQTDTIDLYGRNGGNGLPGGNAGNNRAGTVGNGYNFTETVFHDGYYINYPVKASGGGSGGAAYGANGGNGTNAGNLIGNPSQRGVTTGSGGDGADAVAPAKAKFGCGGNGGNGGGGGGNAGGATIEYYNAYHATVTIGAAGKGGKGSAGGDGGDGVLLIYV